MPAPLRPGAISEWPEGVGTIFSGRVEAGAWLGRAVALARVHPVLGMRLCALGLCSVLLIVANPLRYLLNFG